MYIELKSSGKDNHKALDNLKDFSKGGIIILNNKANVDYLKDMRIYINLLSKYKNLPNFYVSQGLLNGTIGYKGDKIALQQKYKKQYNQDCYGFLVEDAIKEEDLLFFAYFIFYKFNEPCLIYFTKTENVYELTRKKHDNGIEITQDLLEKCKNFDLTILKEELKEKLFNTNYIIFSMPKQRLTNYPLFYDDTYYDILKVITKQKIHFLCIPIKQNINTIRFNGTCEMSRSLDLDQFFSKENVERVRYHKLFHTGNHKKVTLYNIKAF